jgi:monoamine oxidase
VIAPWVVETLLTRHTGTAARMCAGTSGLTRTLALEWLAQVWAADPGDLAVDGMAAVRRDWRSGRQDFVLVDGYRRVPEVLAAGLDVRLGEPVRHVAWSPDGVQVGDVEARAAVITSPPQATSRGIVFDPPLPAEKRKALGELTFGPATVAVVSLTEPAPESAWCLTLGRTGGFLRTTRDRKLLTLCCKGSTARRLPPGEWDAGLVGELAGPVLPWLRGSLIADLRVVDWTADPWACGAFGYPRDGWLDASAAWANPVGKTLFFAGDSTCGSTHPSSVHGALESGVRASAEVLEGVGHVR